jgi:hypothetical protein
MSDVKTFWQEVGSRIMTVLRWASKNLLAPVVAIVIIVVSIVLVSMGFKELQIGGILGKLFGRTTDDPKKNLDVINSIDSDRIDKDGRVIPINQPDSKGDTQVQVVPIDQPGLFSDPNVVTFTPPNSDKPIQIVLPDGVTSKDVDKVVIVSPEVHAIVVRDSSGIDAKKIDDLLAKYGNL